MPVHSLYEHYVVKWEHSCFYSYSSVWRSFERIYCKSQRPTEFIFWFWLQQRKRNNFGKLSNRQEFTLYLCSITETSLQTVRHIRKLCFSSFEQLVFFFVVFFLLFIIYLQLNIRTEFIFSLISCVWNSYFYVR